MSMKKSLRGFSILTALLFVCNLLFALPAFPMRADAAETTLQALYDEGQGAGTWRSGSDNTGAYISPIDNKGSFAFNDGSISPISGETMLRIKLGGGRTYEWMDIRFNPISEDWRETAAIQFWYNPLDTAYDPEVGLGYESAGTYPSVRVNLHDYLTGQGKTVTAGEWVQVTIPFSYLEEHGTYYNAAGTDGQAPSTLPDGSSFNWSRIGAFTVGASTTGMNGQIHWCLIDGANIVTVDGSGEEPGPEPEPEPEPGDPDDVEVLSTIFDEDGVWLKTSSASNVSTPPLDNVAKVGSKSQRIKLAYVESNDFDWVKMIGTPVHNGTQNQGTTALQFWYQPLLARTGMRVGLVAESNGNHESLQVSFDDILEENDITFDYGSGNWYQITIPLSYFAENGTYYDAAETQGDASAFNWARIQGIYLGASAAGLTAQTDWFRIDAVQIVDISGSGDPGTDPEPEPEPEPEPAPVLKALYDEKQAEGTWRNGSDNLGAYISPIDNEGSFAFNGGSISPKSGNTMLRIKLGGGRTYEWMDIRFNPISEDWRETAAIQFWYNPLDTAYDPEVGLGYESAGTYPSVRVNLHDYLTGQGKTVTAGEWVQVTIPFSYLEEHGTYYNAAGTDGQAPSTLPDGSSFNWSRIGAFTVGASTTGMSGQIQWCLFDAVNIVSVGGSGEEPEPGEEQALASVPTLEENSTAVRLNQELTVSFDKPMMASTLVKENFTVDGAAIKTVKANSDATGCTIYFNGALAPSTQYELNISDAVTDSRGLPVDSSTRSFAFTTMAAPAMYFDGVAAAVDGDEIDVLTEGTVAVTANLAGADSAAVVLAALYGDGKLVSAQMLEAADAQGLMQLAADGKTIYTGSVTVPSGNGYELRVFAWDSIAGMKAVADTFYWNASGMGTAQSPMVPKATANSEYSVEYDSQTRQLDISGKLNADDQSNVAVVIAPESLDLSSVTTTDALGQLLYIGHIAAGEGGAFDASMPIDGTAPIGPYVVYLGSEAGGYAQKGNFYVADQQVIDDLIAELNSEALTAEQAKEILENPQLGLDLTNYNLSYVSKDNVAANFVAMRTPFTDVASVKVIFDRALGVELLNVETDAGKLAGWIAQYGANICGEDDAFYQKYLAMDTSDRTAVADIVADQTITSPATAYDAIVVGVIPVYASGELNWKQLADFLTVDSEDYVALDTDAISQNGLTQSAVYKQLLLKRPFASIADIESKFDEAIDDAKGSQGSTGGRPSGGSSGGGGGGGGGFITSSTVISNDNYVPPENNVPNQPEDDPYFVDLDSVQWAKESVEYLADLGVISLDTYFRPNDSVTREEFAKMIVTACGLPTDGAAVSFADVGSDDWFYPYVAAAQQYGIVTGMSETEFGTGQKITRQDMAVMIYRAIEQQYLDTLDVSGQEFADQSAIAPYAADAVKAMRALGIINGADGNNFLPGNFATRAEAAAMIRRAISVLQ